MFGDLFQRNIASLDHKNIDLGNSQNMCFSQGFRSKIFNSSFFFHFLYLGKMERKILFGDFINRKIASLDHKNFDL